MSWAHAKLNLHAKHTLIDRIVHQGMAVAQAAFMANVTRQTAYKWLNRFRADGLAGLESRSSRPHYSPRAVPPQMVESILELRRSSGRGPLFLAWQLDLAASTVYVVLRRHGLHHLRRLDRVTRTIVRYEHEQPGDLVHLDVKKLWRIPDGGGRHFELTSEGGESIPRAGKRGFGYEYLHVAIDDHSRYLYAELLPDYTAETTASFLDRTCSSLADVGVTIDRILTDNGANYRARRFHAEAEQRGIRLKRTRPYRPQTNGKAERVIQTLMHEWAYVRPYDTNDERSRALPHYLQVYNLARPHSALGHRPPISRIL